jgi:hypothetical protein
MTIELSLRRRATHARCFGILWLTLAVAILVGTYTSLPAVADKILSSVSKTDHVAIGATGSGKDDAKEAKTTTTYLQTFAIATLILGLSIISFACYLLGRTSFFEMELAARFGGLADALCMAGNDLGNLEKAAVVFVPKATYLSSPVALSANDIKPLVDAVKKVT